MMNLYEYMDLCREEGMDADEALDQYLRDRAEYNAELMEQREDELLMTAWQEDMIFLRQFER